MVVASRRRGGHGRDGRRFAATKRSRSSLRNGDIDDEVAMAWRSPLRGDETVAVFASRRDDGMIAVASRRRGGHGGDGRRFAATRWSQLYFRRLSERTQAVKGRGGESSSTQNRAGEGRSARQSHTLPVLRSHSAPPVSARLCTTVVRRPVGVWQWHQYVGVRTNEQQDMGGGIFRQNWRAYLFVTPRRAST